MGKTAYLDIKESISELKILLVNKSSLKEEKRLKSLLLIKSGKFKTRQEVADNLFVHIRTLERWLNNYKEGGIDQMITNKPRNKGSKIITSEMHHALSARVNASSFIFDGTQKERIDHYDKNGNILSLFRSGPENTSGRPEVWDDLDFSYIGNKLIAVREKNFTSSDNRDEGFVDNEVYRTEYGYDVDGNLTSDRNKGINSITYNHLNLPTRITTDDGTVDYVYDAIGTKLKKVVGFLFSPATTKTYDAGFIYTNDVLSLITQPEGYVEPNGNGAFTYAYNYLDHLGNVRLTYADSDGDGSINPATEIISEKNYYPFGLTHKGYNNVVSSNSNAVAQNFGYNGKENNPELGIEWMDFGARNYDAALGRWMNLDPLAEDYLNNSPYNYAINNPVLYIDPDGMRVDVGSFFKKEEDESDDEYQERFQSLLTTMMDLSEQSGLSVSAKADGGTHILDYAKNDDGSAAVSKDESGNLIGSSEMRKDLIGAIKDEKIVTVGSTELGTNSSFSNISLNHKRISKQSDPKNAQNMNSKTLGFGMSFMHELHHTKLGNFGAYAGDSDVIDRMNVYRGQLNRLGLNYSRRFGHDVREIDGYIVYPFWDNDDDGRSVDSFLNSQMPTSRSAKYIKVKIDK